MTIVGHNTLKLSSGRTVHFASKQKMASFEKYANAVKHGMKPNKNSSVKGKK